ncbi:DUF4817 domain-containing protein [Trichonephila clavipes]|nr:DUF4817 domain-containing protein [Trichonephila clavipes]
MKKTSVDIREVRGSGGEKKREGAALKPLAAIKDCFLEGAVPCPIVEVEIDGGAIYRNVLSSLREFHRAKSYCHLYGAKANDSCQVIYSQFGLAIHQNDHQARRRFVEWAQNEIAVVPDFHKRILFSDEAHFWLNGYVNKQNCRIWSEANPQVYVETPLHTEKLTVWCALWAGGILLQKR